MYRPARSGNDIEIWGVKEVQEKFEVQNPLQVIDFLGMMGDAVDNIPGLPGVGEKTAKKLLADFGSMENLLANTDKLKGKLRENIENNKEKGILSKQLATIMLDVPVTFDEADFAMSQPDFEAVGKIFDELEFRQLLQNFLKTYQPEAVVQAPPKAASGQLDLFSQGDLFAQPQLVSDKKNSSNTPHFYQLADTPMAQQLLLQSLLQQTEVCFDVEGALKSKEISYIHSEAFASGELKHGICPIIFVFLGRGEFFSGDFDGIAAQGKSLIAIVYAFEFDLKLSADDFAGPVKCTKSDKPC